MKILHADDHPLFREGLRFFLEVLAPDVVALEASNLQGTLDKLVLERPVDLLLLDLQMPGMGDHLEGFFAIRQRFPHLPVLVISGASDPHTIALVLDGGARGFVPKFASSEQLLDALRRALSGQIYIPGAAFQSGSRAGLSNADRLALTTRQLDILPLLADGMANKDIATALGLTEGTVKQHLKELFKRLNASNRMQAVKQARRLGVLRNPISMASAAAESP